MNALPFAILLLIGLPVLLPLRRWWVTFETGRRLEPRWGSTLLDVALMVIYPVGYLVFNSGMKSYGCCGEDAALFATDHLPGLLIVFVLGGVGVAIQARVYRPLPPLLELGFVASEVLWFGLAIGVLIQSKAYVALVIGPALLNVLWALWWRSDLLRRTLEANSDCRFRLALKLLGSTSTLGTLGKLVFVLSGGALLFGLLTGVLYIFGQAPDGFARVFTETYTHPLSRLVHDCSNEKCASMYLCTIGDRGHTWIVGPTRMGWRQGKSIVCSRQLLVSNAFEASLARRLPRLQYVGRMAYDKLGTWFDPNRALFRNPWLCDVVHLIMLPAEGLFLLWLYMVEPQPEQLIADQYLPTSARESARSFRVPCAPLDRLRASAGGRTSSAPSSIAP